MERSIHAQEIEQCYREVLKGTAQSLDIARLKVLQKLSDPNTQDWILATYALAAAYDEADDRNSAFDCLVEANRCQKSLLGYSIDTDKKLFSGIKAMFDDPQPEQSPVAPVFIVGMPRSGTTLTEQILAKHPDIEPAGEVKHMNALGRALIGQKSHLPPEVLFSPQNVLSYRKFYLEGVELSGHFTDKLPTNFLWIGLILTLFPDAKIIHLKRSPQATCWSIFKTCFVNVAFSNDLSDIADYYQMYQDLMGFWHERFPGKIYDLQYETLTEDQEGQTRALLEYCGLSWDDACLEFWDSQRAIETPSAAQVRKPMYQGSSEAWKRYERYLGPILGLNP